MKWGILATGTIAKKFADTVVQMKDEGQQLAAVGSRNLDSARAFAEQYGIPAAHGSYEALAQDPAVEAVYVATPNSMHYEKVRLCLEYGKHVLCEKPFTLTAAQAEELYALAEQKGLFLMEALWIDFLPLYEKLRALLEEGAIGRVTRVSVQYGFVATGARRERKFLSGLGGGALLDIGIYNLGFLQMILPAPEQIETQEVRFTEYGTDEYSRLLLRYPGGCTAESVQTIGQELQRLAVIEGTNGCITLPDFQHAQEMTLRAADTEKTFRFPFDINGFEYQIREAAACVSKGKTHSERYTPAMSIELTRRMQDIRTAWGMKFEGEE